jgi:outer membrane protein assembly factor BamB
MSRSSDKTGNEVTKVIKSILSAGLLGWMVCGAIAAEQAECEFLQDDDVRGIRGGLAVHLHCGDGQTTARLRGAAALVVHGLDTVPENIARARTHFRSRGLGGDVSAAVFDGRHLPYANNLVNLVLADGLRDVPMSEVLRVLAPGGVACIGSGRELVKTVKPWPEDIDQWTHYLHGPDNNAVAQDRVVGPPRHFQWIGDPRFSRSHDHLASVSAVVTAGGRLFSIVDMGSIAFAGSRPDWRLIAQDAFNGIVLWQRSISPWEYHLRDFRSGPADIARRLVATGEQVYVTLGYGLEVVALDAATGQTVQTYAGTEGAQEILYDQGTLLLVVGRPHEDWGAEQAKQIVSQPGYSPPFERYTPPTHQKRIMAVAADSGRLLWQNAQPCTSDVMPSTLATAAGRVYLQNPEAIVCLDAATGQLRWQTPRPIQRQRLAWSTPTLVVHDGVVFSADRRAAQCEGDLLWMPSGGYHEYIRGEDVAGELIALDGQTGQRLWNCPAYEGFNAPVDVMIADDLLWTGRYAWGQDPGITAARDPKTGETRRQRPSDLEFLPRIGHARCHRAKATSEYLILGRRGIEFVDLQTGEMIANHWVRGICQYGVLPANGLIYVPPHSCACSVDDMLKCGFMALAPETPAEDRAGSASDDSPLLQGPADADAAQATAIDVTAEDWPTYRYDAARGGATPTSVPPDLATAWQTVLGGKLTAPVIAGGRVVVAESDRHAVHGLDASTGQALWTFVAGGRVDSPPTIDGRRVIFGAADGHVYCLRLDDGALIWRFRAAPAERLIVVCGQLESAWPVSGSVLVQEGAVFFLAGRNSYLDGGMRLYKLDAATGRQLQVATLEVPQEKRDAGVASGGQLPDVLSSDGQSVFLRSARFDTQLVQQKSNVPHLWSSVGFLDDSWWHRTYWQIGTAMSSGWGGWPKAGQQVPAGRLLVTDGSRVFGFGRNQYDIPGAHVGVDAEGVWGPIGSGRERWTYYQLFGQALDRQADQRARRGADQPGAEQEAWKTRIPVLAQGLVLAGEHLFVAGSPDTQQAIPHQPADSDSLAAALQSPQEGRLLAVSAADGSVLAEYPLDSPPVFDGLAAAGGRLYLCTRSGQIVCLTAQQAVRQAP